MRKHALVLALALSGCDLTPALAQTPYIITGPSSTVFSDPESHQPVLFPGQSECELFVASDEFAEIIKDWLDEMKMSIKCEALDKFLQRHNGAGRGA